MKSLNIKYVCLLISLFLTASGATAQDYKGIWTGHLRAEVYGAQVLNVQYILHVKDQNQNIVNGKAYIQK